MSYNVSHDKLMPPCILAKEFVASPAEIMVTNFAEKKASFNYILGKNCTIFAILYVIECLEVILVPTKSQNVPMGL